MTASTGDMGALKALLGEVATGRSLSEAEAETAFGIIMSGNATPSQMGGLLMALRVRGETVEEITGAARIMRARALPVAAPVDAIDIVGTGGDGAGTLNVSTAAAIVVAACSVPVAKHGNKALSSRSGAADVLSALGVNIDAEPQALQRCLAEAGIAFLMAPRHHVATRHVAPTRGELGTRTIFNLLGPLTNPAGVRRHLIGVFAERWVTPLAEVLGRLGSERAWVVHSEDGLDEISLAGPTHVAALENGAVRRFQVTPEDAGLPRAPAGSVRGGDPAENAAALSALLAGAAGSYRDIVLINAAAALIVAGAVTDLRSGVKRAAAALDDGSAARVLAKLVAVSRSGLPPPPKATLP